MEQRQNFFKPIDGFIHPKNETSRESAFFAPLHQKEVEQTRQDENTKEKMTSLHSKLYQEADKIRKWKTQTDIDIKQKNRQLNEANTTIENLRKSLLDVQLKNENLSMQFQQELGNKEEITQKINATRDMCNLLKDYSEKVEVRIDQCEKDRTQLKEFEYGQIKQLEELSKTFQNLEVTTATTRNNLLKELKAEEQEKIEMKEEYNKLVNETRKELDDLSRISSEKTKAIQTLTENMTNAQEKWGILRVEYALLQEQYGQKEIMNTDLKDVLNSMTQEVDDSKLTVQSLEQVVNEQSTELLEAQSCKDSLERHWVEAETIYMDKLNNLKTEYDALRNKAEINIKRLTEAKSALHTSDQTLEETKCTKDMLLLQSSELNVKLHRYEQKEDELTKTISEKENELSELNAEIVEKDANIEKMLTASRKQVEETEHLKDDIHKAVQNEKLAYAMVEKLKSQIEDKSEETCSISSNLKELETANKVFLRKTEQLEEKVQLLEETAEKSTARKAQIEDEVAERGRTLKSLREELAVVNEEHRLTISKLEDKTLAINNYICDIEKLTKDVEVLDAKNKNIEEIDQTKAELIMHLEEKVHSLKDMYTIKESDYTTRHNENELLRQELLKAQENSKSLQKKIKEHIGKNAQCNRDVQFHKSESKSIQEEKLACKKEFAVSKVLHDSEMSKMFNLLENYKIMNQRNVEDKQNEIDKILKSTQTNQHEQENQLSILQNENKKVKTIEEALAAKDESLVQMTKRCEEQKQKLDEFDVTTKCINEKEKLFSKLEKELSKTKELCSQQKEKLKSLEKSAKLLKDKEKELIAKEKDLSKFKETCTKQNNDIASLKKQLKDNTALKEKETEVEKLRREVELLKVVSVMNPVSTPEIVGLSGQENRSIKENQNKECKQAKAMKTKTPPRLSTPKNSVSGFLQGKVPAQEKSKTPVKIRKKESPAPSNVKIPAEKNIRTPVPPKSRTPTQSKITTRAQSTVKTPLQGRVQAPTVVHDVVESLFKRRKVMFSDLLPEKDKDSTDESPEESCTSSSSELIDFQPTPAKGPFQSPAVYQTPTINKSYSAQKKLTRLIPVPRGPAIDKKRVGSKEVSNIRITPIPQSYHHFFKSSPAYKFTNPGNIQPKPKPKADTSWFDTDLTFGF